MQPLQSAALDDLKIISVDDHIMEPPDLWTTRLPSKYKDVGPRVERILAGNFDWKSTVFGISEADPDDPDARPCDVWCFEDLRKPVTRNHAAVSYPNRADIKNVGMTYDEMRPGCFRPGPRMKDMDQAGIEASMCFPNIFTRFCGQTFLEAKDHDLGLLCVKAYNDFVVDEWCNGSNGRLIPLCIVPLWDPHLAADEVRRNAARGVTAVCFSELPAKLGLPSIHDKDRYWDPFFAACNETATVINMHIGSSSQEPSTSDDMPGVLHGSFTMLNTFLALNDWLFCGVFDRFPNLKIVFSEGQIGWIPFVLERADNLYRSGGGWGESVVIKDLPSGYYYDHIFGCFFDDKHGIDSLDIVGENNVMFESDYPHQDSNWPRTHEAASRQLAHLSANQIEKIVRGNAISLYRLNL